MVSVVLLGVFLYSGYRVYDHYAEESRAARQFDELTQRVRSGPADEPAENGTGPSSEMTSYEKYAALFEQNEDMVGWLRIDGTTIDYPVMQTPQSPNFYLDHDFERNPSRHGVPYAVEECDVLLPSDNITIYGHHMKSGRMFGALKDYKSEAFYREYPTVHFDTRADFGAYTILAVLITTPGRFAYDRFIQAEDAAAFEEYVTRCKSLSLYDTGVTAVYGDKLITLSTCEYSEKDGRLVVVAKRMSE